MKNLKKKFRFRINLKSKHLLAIMTLFCLSCIVATFASGISTAPLQEAAGIVIVPFEKSIEKIGSMVRSVSNSFKDKQDLLFENEELKAELDSLTTQNNKLIQDQGEFTAIPDFFKKLTQPNLFIIISKNNHFSNYKLARITFGLQPAVSSAFTIWFLWSVPNASRVIFSSTAALRLVLTNWL